MKYRKHTIRAVAKTYEIWDLDEKGNLFEMAYSLPAENGDIAFYQAFSPENEECDNPLLEHKSLKQLRALIDARIDGQEKLLGKEKAKKEKAPPANAPT